MMISTRGRYALRLMIDLAQHYTGEYTALKDVCARQEISLKYLEQIVAQLSKAGLLKSARGAQGGYRLAKPPEEYTAASILRLTEGNLAPVACLEHEPNECARYENCAAVKFWQGLYQAVNNYVEGVTLAELAGADDAGPKARGNMPVYFL